MLFKRWLIYLNIFKLIKNSFNLSMQKVQVSCLKLKLIEVMMQ